MKTKNASVIAGVALLALLMTGIAPLVATAQQNQSGSPAGVIQLAQQAQAYAIQIVAKGQQHGLSVTQAQSLIAQGNQSLTQAQNEASSNPQQAYQDATTAMSDYRNAVQSVQSQVGQQPGGGYSSNADQVTSMQAMIQRGQGVIARLQAVITKVCGAQNASANTCSDANSNLAAASTDLSQASAALASVSTNSSSAQQQMSDIRSTLSDAIHRVNQVYSDLKDFATADQAQRAVSWIQTKTAARLAADQAAVQNANLTSSDTQADQALLTQAQTLLNSAVQSFPTDFKSGVNDAQQAMKILDQVEHSITFQKMVAQIQARLNQDQTKYQGATNLNSSMSAQVQTQLGQAQTFINNADQSIQAQNFSAGMQQLQQAVQLLQQVEHELA